MTGMGEFNSDDHYIYYCEQESFRRNEQPSQSTRVQNAVLGCNLKNDRMISVHFQSKPFNTMVIQAYVPTSKADEAEDEWFYKDLKTFQNKHQKKMSFSLQGTGMGEFNSDNIIFTTVGRNPLEEMEQPSWSTKESVMQYLDAISKMTE